MINHCFCIVSCSVIWCICRGGAQTSTKQSLTLFTVPRTWSEAHTICEANGMTLVKIESDTKQLYVKEFMTDWGNTITLTTRIWIGLHETDPSNSLIVEWTDCTENNYHSQYASGEPSLLLDDKKCYSSDTTGEWKATECGLSFMFICEKDIGSCDFYTYYEQTGCGISLKLTQELNLQTCLDTCLNGVMSSGEQCWSVGFWPGYSGDDCWMFYSFDPHACEQNNFYYSAITMYMKTCFQAFTDSANHNVPSNPGNAPVSPCLRLESTTEGTTEAVSTQTSPTVGEHTDTTDMQTTATTTSITSGQQSSVQQFIVSTSPSAQTEVLTTQGVTTIPEVTTTPEVTETPEITTDMFTTQYEQHESTENTTTTISVEYTNTTTGTVQNVNCSCSCVPVHDREFLEQKMLKMKKELSVDKRKTSKFIRKLTSAEDNRPSAVSIGACGFTCLVAVSLLIVSIDISTWIKYCKQIPCKTVKQCPICMKHR